MDVNTYNLTPNPRTINAEPGDDIFVQIVIGNRQIGGNNLSYEGNEILKGDLSQKAFLGTSEELSDKNLDTITNVLDVNPATNNCVITTTFSTQENQILFSKVDRGEAPANGIAQFRGVYKIQLVILLFTVLSFLTDDLFAQSETDFIDLKTPTSPGFVLLDETPSSIETPSTPKGLAISLLNFSEENLALEFAPFWLIDHPNLVAEDLKDVRFPILENLSISLATLNTDSVDNLAFGLRTRIFQNFSSDQVNDLAQKKRDIQTELGNIPLDLKKIEKLRAEYVNLALKPVFSIDFAAAVSSFTTTNSYDDLEPGRWAIWTSFNWRPKADDFYVTALTRYIRNDTFENYDPDTDLFDVGVRFNYDIKSAYTASLEYVHRMNITAEEYDDYRLAAVGSYQLTDNIYLTTTVGKNFTGVSNIIALAGINFGISKSKVTAY